MEIEKIRILLADDELYWRNIFFKYWNRLFASNFPSEIIECEFAYKAIEELEKTRLSYKYFDIVIADINFSENEIHESSTAGFEIIELAKKIHFKTRVLWYSAQSQETETFERFLKESKLLKDGFIDFQIKKAWIVQSFKTELDKCLKIITYEKKGLLFPLSQLFETYNYAINQNDGFYKLTHSNFTWQEMKDILPGVKKIYQNLHIDDLLSSENAHLIVEYLNLVGLRNPQIFEMEQFKSHFRFEFSQNLFHIFQRPIISKGVECKNDFSFDFPFRIYAEKARITRGFETIYENIAQHNFSKDVFSEYVISHFTLLENELIIEIISSGNGFNPEEKFRTKRTGGLSIIYDSFKHYCQLFYESQKTSYNVYQDAVFQSSIENGLKVTLKFLLPEIKNRKNKMRLLNG